MSALAIASEPTSLVAVNDQCSRVELWAERCESIPELQDANNKLAAINEYLERTSTEGRARVAAARRRLEVRIGKLLGAAQIGAHSSATEGADLTRHERSDFRKLAANEDIVEQVIAESTDDAPASRKRTMRVIDGGPAVKVREKAWANRQGRPDLQVAKIVNSLSVVADSLRSFDPGDYRATEEEIEDLDLVIKALRQFRKSLVQE